MKIFIGYDIDDNPIWCLVSDSREKVEIAAAAMGQTPHRIEEVIPSKELGINGVIFLLTSKECNSRRDYGHRDFGVDFRQWKRGL